VVFIAQVVLLLERGHTKSQMLLITLPMASVAWVMGVGSDLKTPKGIFTFLILLVICCLSGCTVVSGVVVYVCNRSQMRTSKYTCLIFGVSIGLDPV